MRTFSQPEQPYSMGNNKLRSKANRTGGNTIAGGCYLLDLPQADGDSGTIGAGLDNILVPATANFCSPVVVAQSVVADNARVQCIESQDEWVLVDELLVEGTTDIAKGDPLKLVNGQAYLVKATIGTDHFNAIALEAFTTNATGTIKALFCSRRQF